MKSARYLLLTALPVLLALLPPAAAGEPPRAVVAAVAAEYVRSIKYYLSRYGQNAATAALPGRDSAALVERAVAAAGADPSQDGLLAAVRGAITADPDLRAEEVAAIEAAVRETSDYFDVGAVRLLEPQAVPAAAPAPAAGGFAADIEALPSARLPMAELDTYLLGQAGPLSALLDGLGGDLRRVVFSRRSLGEALALAGGNVSELYRLRLPGATYAFEAYLTGGARPALLLCSFSGGDWYEHVQRVYRLLLSRKSLTPEIAVDHRPAPVRPCAGLRAAFAGKMPREFQGLLLGYYQELRSAFFPYLRLEESTGEYKAFAAVINGRTYVALEASDSWYGDILGASVTRLLDDGIKFKEVYFAGSAGSLAYHTPYAASYPDCFYGRGGEKIPLANSMAGSGGGCHKAVPSPLAETGEYLAALPADALTIDVEGLGLVEAARAGGVALGVTYLITDYPRGLRAAGDFSLAGQRHKAKLAGTRRYAETLLARLRDGRAQYQHPVEAAAGRSVKELSAANMAALRAALGPLSPDEREVAGKIAAAPPPVIMRMNRARFKRVLEAGLALAPSEVAALTGVPVSTRAITPAAENDLYGAWAYLFAGVGQNNRAGLYGDYQVFVASAAWAARSYATPHAGYRLAETYGPGEIAKARAAWSALVIAPEHYAEYLALAYVTHARREGAPPAAAASPRRLTAGCETCYLEGKILKYFTLDEIACVELPPGAAQGLPLPAALRARTYDTPGACLGTK